MARRHSLLYLHCLLKFKTEEFTIAGEAENKSPLGFAACLSKNSKFLTQNSDGSCQPLLCFLCFSAYGRVLWSQVFVKALPTTADSLNDV